MKTLRLVVLIVIALLVALWWTRETIKPSLIMGLADLLRAQAAAERPLVRGGFCWPAKCVVG